MEAAREHDVDWLHVVAATLGWKTKTLENNTSALKRLFNLGGLERSVLDTSERKLLAALKLIPNPNSRTVSFNILISMRRCDECPVSQLEAARTRLKAEVDVHRKAAKETLELYTADQMAAAIDESAEKDPNRCAMLIIFEQLGCRILDLGGTITVNKKAAEAAEGNSFVIRSKDVLVVRKVYKTVAIYGVKHDAIRGARGRLLRRCLLKIGDGNALVRLVNGKPCPREQLSARIAAVCQASPTTLFKSRVNVLRQAGDITGIKALAATRGTNMETIVKYYVGEK